MNDSNLRVVRVPAEFRQTPGRTVLEALIWSRKADGEWTVIGGLMRNVDSTQPESVWIVVVNGDRIRIADSWDDSPPLQPDASLPKPSSN